MSQRGMKRFNWEIGREEGYSRRMKNKVRMKTKSKGERRAKMKNKEAVLFCLMYHPTHTFSS